MPAARRKTHHACSLAAALGMALGASFTAHAAPGPCDGSSDPCAIDLGRVTAYFSQGAASYNAVAEMFGTGTDGSTYAVPDFLGSLQQQHTATSDGFSFAPVVWASVGGSGINGFHEARGFFEFTGLSFQANPGWRLDALTLTVTGSRNYVGDATAWLGLPFAVSFDGDAFTGSGALNPADASVHAEFNLNAAYLQGDDGTAISYGAASASFATARFVATVSAVPEPGTAALLPLGLLGLGAALRRRQRAATARPA